MTTPDEATIRRVWKQKKGQWHESYGPVFRAYDDTSISPQLYTGPDIKATDFQLPIYTFERKSLIKHESGVRSVLTFIECGDVILEGIIQDDYGRTAYPTHQEIKRIVDECKQQAIYPIKGKA